MRRRSLRPPKRLTEERVTSWCAADFDTAISMAEQEGDEYLDAVGGERFPLAQPSRCLTSQGDGAEVFSLVRRHPLDAEEHLDRHFNTGTKYQRPYWLPDDCRRHTRSSALRPRVRTRRRDAALIRAHRGTTGR